MTPRAQLIEHEAERQDLEERVRLWAQPAVRYAARRIVDMLRAPDPTTYQRSRASDWFVAEVLVNLILSLPRWQRLVDRQARERHTAFAAPRRGRLRMEKITRAEVGARVEARRETERTALEKPAAPLRPVEDGFNPADRQLPSRESLDGRPVEYLVRLADRLGADVDLARLREVGQAAAGQVTRAENPDIATLLRAQEALESAVQRELASQAKGWVRAAEQERMGLVGRGSGRVTAIWQAVGDERTCASCDHRHGDERTMSAWRDAGLPGSENLVCGKNCRCMLLPAAWFEPTAAEDAA